MQKRIRLRSVLTALAAAALIGPSAFALPAAAQPKEVKVAVIAPLSGPWARQGQLMQIGAEMAIDEINEKGGIKALGGAKLKLLLFDAGDSAEKAKNAAQRMLAQEPDLVGATGAWLSSFTLAVTEITERAGVPVLTLSYSDAITERGFKYVFQTSPTGGTQAKAALPTILQLAEKATGKKPKTVGIIMDNTAAPVSFVKPMREGGLKALGLDLVVDEVFTPPLADATGLVQKVRRVKPELMLLLPTSVPDDKLILEKFNEFKLGQGKIPLIANGAHIGSPELLKNVGAELLEGLMFIVANWGVKGQESIIERFKKRTGEPWITQDSMTAYGDMWIFKEALERAGAADAKKVAEEIRKLDLKEGPAALAYPGGVKFEANGRRAGAHLVIAQWQKGQAVTVYPAELALAPPIWPKP
ncbi:MAG: ABC transporter substrate-binding protein [Alphaproteobacteria bacterium]|nr:ABC transporter substrate-binding protein [Alphaproteobacteria bacterium]